MLLKQAVRTMRKILLVPFLFLKGRKILGQKLVQQSNFVIFQCKQISKKNSIITMNLGSGNSVYTDALVITNHHKVGDLKNSSFSHSSGVQRSEIKVPARLPPKALQEHLCLLLPVSRSFWHSLGCGSITLCLCLHMVFSMCLCVQISPFLLNTGWFHLEILIISAKNRFLGKSLSEVLGECGFWEDSIPLSTARETITSASVFS